jgi:hypothetical protein
MLGQMGILGSRNRLRSCKEPAVKREERSRQDMIPPALVRSHKCSSPSFFGATAGGTDQGGASLATASSIVAFYPVLSMPSMPGRGDPARDFAEKAERRARFALGYLVIFCVVLIFIFVAMMW